MNELELNTNQKVHFIGIGGVSMSGLAHILLDRGIPVSGSDMKQSALTDELASLGAEIRIGQSGDNITDDIHLVVYTAAISPDNPELKAAKEAGIRTMVRADFLGLLMKHYQQAICVSGTHGKTTTTSLLSQIFLDAGADPTISVGGVLPSIGGNVRIGHSDLFITEACEYTNSFLSFFPTTEIILNVQEDHMDFFKDLDDIRNSFRLYSRLLPEDGLLVINGEIDDLSYFTDGLSAKVVTFGLKEGCEVRAEQITYNAFACAEYDLTINGERAAHVALKLPGEHNVYNSLAALAAAIRSGIAPEDAAASVSVFTGVDRRFQQKGTLGGITIVDDYAHHPDEIRATLSAAKKMPHGRLLVVFQPHTYTRTKAFLDEFADALSLADMVILAPIYAARETDTLGISSDDIKKRIDEKGIVCHSFPSFDAIENFLLENCVNEDLLITMGAGDVYIIGEKLLGN